MEYVEPRVQAEEPATDGGQRSAGAGQCGIGQGVQQTIADLSRHVSARSALAPKTRYDRAWQISASDHLEFYLRAHAVENSGNLRLQPEERLLRSGPRAAPTSQAQRHTCFSADCRLLARNLSAVSKILVLKS
jgi:hypothetical protein